jgi:hypothetical protein
LHHYQDGVTSKALAMAVNQNQKNNQGKGRGQGGGRQGESFDQPYDSYNCRNWDNRQADNKRRNWDNNQGGIWGQNDYAGPPYDSQDRRYPYRLTTPIAVPAQLPQPLRPQLPLAPSISTCPGKCNKCGTPGHWVKDCEPFHLESQMQALKIQMNNLDNAEANATTFKDYHLDSGDQLSIEAQAITFSDKERAEETSGDAGEVLDAFLSEVKRTGKWYIDSGATAHVTGDRTLLNQVEKQSTHSHVNTAGGEKLLVVGKGSVHFDQNKTNDVYYVPGVCKNLLSLGSLTDQGHVAVFDSSNCFVFDKGNPNKLLL